MTLDQEIKDSIVALRFLKIHAVSTQSYEIASSLRSLEKDIYTKNSIEESKDHGGYMDKESGEYIIKPGIDELTLNQFLHIHKALEFLATTYKKDSSFISFGRKINSLIRIEMRERKIDDILS